MLAFPTICALTSHITATSISSPVDTNDWLGSENQHPAVERPSMARCLALWLFDSLQPLRQWNTLITATATSALAACHNLPASLRCTQENLFALSKHNIFPLTSLYLRSFKEHCYLRELRIGQYEACGDQVVSFSTSRHRGRCCQLLVYKDR